MKLSTKEVIMKKRYPLRISRELITESRNLLLTLQQGDFVGAGEIATDGDTGANSPEAAEVELLRFTAKLQVLECFLTPCQFLNSGLKLALWECLRLFWPVLILRSGIYMARN